MAGVIDPIAPRVPFLADPSSNIVSREWFGFFNQTRRQGNASASGTFLTLDDQTADFPNSLTITPVAGELAAATVASQYQLGLADTAVSPGAYGDAKHLVKITVDQKGRATALEAFVLNSDNVTEGLTNLFFTQDRARASVGAGTGLTYVVATGVFSLTNTAVAPGGSYGAANKSPSFTVNAQGQLTAAADVTITIAAVAGAAPIADGVHACGTGFITTVNGIITAITP